MTPAEFIPNRDSVNRQIDFPNMYNDVKDLIWENVFQFLEGQPESVVWGKYAPTPDDVHRIGCEREANTRERKPQMRYVGYLPSTAGVIRDIKTRPGHGFSVIHAPLEGIHHAEIAYRATADRKLTKGEKTELKFALRQVFGDLVPYLAG
jgi:hypothetical protein